MKPFDLDLYKSIIADRGWTSAIGSQHSGEIEIVVDEAEFDDSSEESAAPAILYFDKYITVVRDKVVFPDGKRGTYLRILVGKVSSGNVCIVPIIDDKFVLLRQFRHATRRWHYEFPRGFSEPGYDIAENAARELQEELNCTALSIELAGSFFPDSGLLVNNINVFVARLDVLGDGRGDFGTATVLQVSAEQFASMIDDREIDDGITLAAYAVAKGWLSRKGGELQKA